VATPATEAAGSRTETRPTTSGSGLNPPSLSTMSWQSMTDIPLRAGPLILLHPSASCTSAHGLSSVAGSPVSPKAKSSSSARVRR